MARKPSGPPLKFKRNEKKIWKGNLDIEVIEMLEAYPDWHQQTTGEPAPTQEEVIEGVVRKLLGGHSDFKKFLEDRRATAGGAGARSAGASAARTSTKGRE
jgi:hypothetical protein